MLIFKVTSQTLVTSTKAQQLSGTWKKLPTQMQQKKRFPTDQTVAPVPEYITAPPVIPARPNYIPFPQPNYFPDYPGKEKIDFTPFSY